MRARRFAAAIVGTVIPLGLVARAFRAQADPTTVLGFLATYAGDTLWPIMFYFLARFGMPKARSLLLGTCVLALTLFLEFGQLWNPGWLSWLRQQPGIGFVLGNTFIWSDVVCCTVGTALAASIDGIRLTRVVAKVD